METGTLIDTVRCAHQILAGGTPALSGVGHAAACRRQVHGGFAQPTTYSATSLGPIVDGHSPFHPLRLAVRSHQPPVRLPAAGSRRLVAGS